MQSKKWNWYATNFSHECSNIDIFWKAWWNCNILWSAENTTILIQLSITHSLLKCFKKQVLNSIIYHRINVKYSKVYNNKIPHAVMGYNNVNEMYARFLSQNSISLSDYRATWNSIYLCKINSVRNRICTQCNEEKMVNLCFALFFLLYI